MTKPVYPQKCPYCEHLCNSRQAKFAHIRSQHPDKRNVSQEEETPAQDPAQTPPPTEPPVKTPEPPKPPQALPASNLDANRAAYEKAAGVKIPVKPPKEIPAKPSSRQEEEDDQLIVVLVVALTIGVLAACVYFLKDSIMALFGKGKPPAGKPVPVSA